MRTYIYIAAILTITSCAQAPDNSSIRRTSLASVGASCQSLGDECDKNHPCCGTNICVAAGTYGGICEEKK